MNFEYSSIAENKNWELVKNKGKKTTVSRWHSALDFVPSGEITKFEAKFVAKGFSKVPGRDYNKTYSPTQRFSNFRELISYAL